jgi:protein-disulfide isomerase
VAAIAVGSGIFLYQKKRPANAPTMAKAGPEAPSQLVHSLGPENSPVTLEEFGDFQCPPCGLLSEPINQLQKQYNLRVIFRNFPLAMHAHAKEAAYAAEAAGKQGKFWPMHDLLYREQPVWSKAPDARALFNAYAGMLQLDLDRFKQDMDSPEVQQQVELDERRGTVIGVKTTPTVFLNNEAIPPTQANPNDLPAVVEAAVKKAKPSS